MNTPKHLTFAFGQFTRMGQGEGRANANVLLLSLSLREPPQRIEKLWRTAKKMVKNEGEKHNYLLAWAFVLKMSGVEIARPFRFKLAVRLGRFYGYVDDFDEEYVALSNTDTGERIRMPITQAYLLNLVSTLRPHGILEAPGREAA